jgi:hypothetical protein
MWTKFDDFRFCVKIGLRKGLARIRGMGRALTDDEQETVAKEIVEHLELSNWKIEPGEPLPGHGSNFTPDQK